MKGVDLTRRNDSGPRTEAVDGELVAYGASFPVYYVRFSFFLTR
jgi:hypothetical protein